MAIRRDRELRLTLQSEGGMYSSSLSLVEYFFLSILHSGYAQRHITQEVYFNFIYL